MMMRIGATTMLARLPENDRQIAGFRQALALPKKGAALLEAELTHQTVRSELDAVGAELTRASTRLYEGGFESKRLLLDEEMALKAEVATISATRGEIATRERSAMSEVERLRVEYERDLHRLLAPAARSLSTAIDAQLAHAQELIKLADEVRDQARAAGVEIDSALLVGGSKQLCRIIDQVRGSLSRMTAASKACTQP